MLLTSSTLEGRFKVGVLYAQHVLWAHTLYPHLRETQGRRVPMGMKTPGK